MDVASFPGLPTIQFLIACTLQVIKNLTVGRLQVIKNWMVGRPGNEATWKQKNGEAFHFLVRGRLQTIFSKITSL